MFTKFNKRNLWWAFMLFMPGILMAQDKSATVPAASNDGSVLSTVMIIMSIILAFVIWGMGQVLVALSRQLWEKTKNAKIWILAIFLTLSMTQGFAQSTDAPAAMPVSYGGLNETAFWVLSMIIALEVVSIFFILFFIRRINQELMPETKKKTSPLAEWWSDLDKKFFTKAVPVEKEADVLLDHDYDGIRELDNSLPPWWKYGFYVTIVVGIIYLFNFHVFGSGKDPQQEYQAEMDKARMEQEAYAAKNADQVDEKNLQMPAKGGLDEAKDIFTSVCWTCHGKAGEGGTGPNLTDDYWIHKGSLSDVYMSIKHGYPDKGMQAWEKNYSPKQINNLAGYIKTLHGTNPPNPKAPQGDLFVEQTDSTSKPMKDSTKKMSK